MPVWKASREGTRERGKEEGKERGGRESGHCVVWDRRGFVCWVWLHHPSVFLWIWSQQHILFCHYLSSRYSSTECCKLAPERRHVFTAALCQHDSWRMVSSGECEWSDLRDKYTAKRCYIDDGLVYYLWSLIRKRETSLDPTELIRQINANWNWGVNWVLQLLPSAGFSRFEVCIWTSLSLRPPLTPPSSRAPFGSYQMGHSSSVLAAPLTFSGGQSESIQGNLLVHENETETGTWIKRHTCRYGGETWRSATALCTAEN